MNKLNTFMQEKYDMKSFNHTPSTKTLPEILTETINGKRFYVTPEGKKYPSILTNCLKVDHHWLLGRKAEPAGIKQLQTAGYCREAKITQVFSLVKVR